MIEWSGFRNNLIKFLSSIESSGPEETARYIANEYDKIALTATLIPGNIVTSGTDKASLEKAIYEAFVKMYEAWEVDLMKPPYLIMANGFVKYWTNSQFAPTPPHAPDIAPTSGVEVLIPGLNTPLDQDLYDAFRAGWKEDSYEISDYITCTTKVVDAIISALKKFHLTIEGVYHGLIPATPSPVPGPPVPWKGIQ